MDVHFEVAIDSETQVFLGALVSTPIDWEQFSQFKRLKFMVMRILKTLRKDRNLVLVDLIKLAEFKIWLLVQRGCFSSKIVSLKKAMTVQSQSKLIGLSPFLDSDGFVGVKGKLRKADLEYQIKHPIILHSQHWAVNFFLEEMHKTWHHEGVEYLRGVVQQKFCIHGLKKDLRSGKHDCVQR